jgi:hypothetical protein
VNQVYALCCVNGESCSNDGCASVNVCREVKRRNETSTQQRYGSNEWTQDPDAGTRVGHREHLGRHGTARIQSTGAADLEVSSANSCVSNECNFWPKLEAVAQSVFPGSKFLLRDSGSHDGL